MINGGVATPNRVYGSRALILKQQLGSLRNARLCPAYMKGYDGFIGK
jgi:hypothetical protein